MLTTVVTVFVLGFFVVSLIAVVAIIYFMWD